MKEFANYPADIFFFLSLMHHSFLKILSLLSFLSLALAPSPPLSLFSSSGDRFKDCAKLMYLRAKVLRLCPDEKPSYFNYSLFLKILFQLSDLCVLELILLSGLQHSIVCLDFMTLPKPPMPH